jgi:acyl carrier protein
MKPGTKGVNAVDERLVELLRSFLPLIGTGPLSEETRLRDCGLDSIQAVDLLLGIEDTFQVSLPDEFLHDETFATAGALWRVVAGQLRALEPAPTSRGVN